MQLISIVQGESAIAEIMRSFLLDASYAVRLFTRATDLVAEADRHRPGLVLVEIGTDSNGLDSYGVVRATASLANVPVMCFSSGNADEDRILTLESGADDYIGQPFTRRELIARVQAVLRRFSPSANDGSVPARQFSPFLEGLPPEVISIGDIQIDTSAMKVSVRGNEITTTTLEFRLIYFLATQQYRVFTRDQLLDAVWGGEFVTPRSVDACIGRIRRKIEPDRNKPTYLKTIRGAGYLLDIAAGSRHFTSAKPDAGWQERLRTAS
jgi:DNA-binding response OmpR family regulator